MGEFGHTNEATFGLIATQKHNRRPSRTAPPRQGRTGEAPVEPPVQVRTVQCHTQLGGAAAATLEEPETQSNTRRKTTKTQMGTI